MILTEQELRSAVRSSEVAQALRPEAGLVAASVSPHGAAIVIEGDVLSATSPMEIGSLTKIFTALLLAKTVLCGQMSLDTTVEEALGMEDRVPRDAMNARDLASHTSGLPRLSLPWYTLLDRDPYATYSEAKLVNYLRRRPLQRPEPKRFEYSNLGFSVLGLMLERNTGLPYERLLGREVLEPLGMGNTLIQRPGTTPSVVGYRRRGKRPAPRWHWLAYAPCGGLTATPQAMIAFLNGLISKSSPVADAVALTAKPVYVSDARRMGLAWICSPESDWVWMTGGTAGFSSYLGLSRSLEAGVLLMTNQSNPLHLKTLGDNLAESTQAKITALVPALA